MRHWGLGGGTASVRVTHMVTISTCGAMMPSSVSNPRRNLEMMTSACDFGVYAVQIAAIRLTILF